MAVTLLLLRLLLSLVFLIAGLAKLADLPGSQKALHNFGVPEALAGLMGIVLPIVEIGVAVALIPRTWSWYGAIGAFALLLIFCVGIGYNLALGRRPDCHCFGQLHSAPVGPSTLVRNILLALGAAFVVWFGRGSTGLSATSWFTTMPLAQQVALVAAALAAALMAGEGWLLLHALGQQGRLLLRLERTESRLAQEGFMFAMPERERSVTGLPVGAKAPAFSGTSLDEKKISLDGLCASGKPVVLIFTSPTCAPCSELLPEIGRWQRDYADKLTIALLSHGSTQENSAKAAEHGISRIVLQRLNEIDILFGVQRTPSAVLIGPDGFIESSIVVGSEDIQTLVSRAASLRQLPVVLLGNGGRAQPEPSVPEIGTQAPAFRLPDLKGEPVSLSSFRNTLTLLLFWNPDCGFCKSMLSDLKAWEANPPQGAPRLLVISDGTAEENRLMGLRSPVLLDKEGAVKMLFGSNGTPTAMLVDAQGKIASALAEGASDVLALAGHVKEEAPSPRARLDLIKLVGGRSRLQS
ncbi:hypothetical protein KSC_040200 [Ktedonobacter sp. SOSP1-52]|uniref:MauE/DoxX family redox-associated membrane protein n=1 Tax=Ktedonobacter sp. SOSP1-52 TaxID=2778366 RepID=UPI001915EC98|nr:MauE/DoxX family redox-associated membrane protein [Ktedonobacter sp. SOSP1-52]GHO65128.1 hypothetical protein KSC_040200 [Ktedonobacter sp. SOSP1-52]